MTSIQKTEYGYNTTTIQMGFRKKSNDLFESVSQEFTLLICVRSYRNCHLCKRIMVALCSCLAIWIVVILAIEGSMGSGMCSHSFVCLLLN